MDSYKLLLLNQHLSDRKYLGGDQPAKADDVVFTETRAFVKDSTKGQLPKALSHVQKWYNEVVSFPEEERKQWAGDECMLEQCVVSWPEVFVRQMIDEIDSLLLAASVTTVEYNRKHLLLNRGTLHFSARNENVVFKHLISDLYSVLDHLIVLLYCHYKRNGQPDFSHDVLKMKFPFLEGVEYPANGEVSADVVGGLKKRRDQFMTSLVNNIFGNQPDGGHEWLAEKIISVQLHTLVSAGGERCMKSLEDGSDQQVFSQLYFLNHYRSHHGLISISPEPKYLSLCTCTYPATHISPHDSHFDECTTKTAMSRGMFVYCPDDIRSASEDKVWSLKPLTVMTERFIHFVKMFRDDVLKKYFNIPSFDMVYKVRGGYDDGFRVNHHFIAWEDHEIQRPVPL
eukprot:gene4720-5343_t